MTTIYAKYHELTMSTIVSEGCGAAIEAFQTLEDDGDTESGNLAVQIITIDGALYSTYGIDGIGQYEQYIPYVSPESGKLAAVIRFNMNSGLAFATHPAHEFFGTKDNKRRWTGGARQTYTHTRDNGDVIWITFGCAASGDHSPANLFAAEAACARMGFLWMMWQRALEEAEMAEPATEQIIPGDVAARGPRPATLDLGRPGSGSRRGYMTE